MAQILQKKKDG